MSGSVEYEISDRLGDYEGIFLKKDKKYLLELRVSGTALVNAPCNLGNVNIYEWLRDIGVQHLDKVKEYEIVTILSKDVLDQELSTDWELLRREPVPQQFDS